MNPILSQAGKTSYPLTRIFRKILINIQRSVWIPSPLRIKLLRLAGLKIGQRTFIGDNVTFDGAHPELITIGNHVGITSGTKILTHFVDPDTRTMHIAGITIEDEVFIAMNTLIVNRVNIGKNSFIAAGSVVTKDIPPYEVWGGIPAKFLRKINIK